MKKSSHARKWVEKQYGSVRAGLLTELERYTPVDLAAEWDVHYNTILNWMERERVERRVTYHAKEEESAGAGS